MHLFWPYAPVLPHTDTLLNLDRFWAAANPQPTAQRGRVKRFYCFFVFCFFFFSWRESLEVGDEWGHQLNKPSVLSCCPRLRHSASSARFLLLRHRAHACEQPHILEYINLSRRKRKCASTLRVHLWTHMQGPAHACTLAESAKPCSFGLMLIMNDGWCSCLWYRWSEVPLSWIYREKCEKSMHSLSLSALSSARAFQPLGSDSVWGHLIQQLFCWKCQECCCEEMHNFVAIQILHPKISFSPAEQTKEKTSVGPAHLLWTISFSL